MSSSTASSTLSKSSKKKPSQSGNETGAIPKSGSNDGTVSRRTSRGHDLNRSTTSVRASQNVSISRPSSSSSSASTLRRSASNLLDSFMEWVPSQPSHQTEADPCQDAESEGQELYLHFFHERLRREGLADAAREEEWAGQYHLSGAHLDQHQQDDHCGDDDDDNDDSNENYPVDEDDCGRLTMRSRERNSCPRKRKESMNLGNFQNPLWRQAGRELMALAERFERSSEREEVRRRAETVNVANIDYDKFMMLLGALFPDGQLSQERILVLFYFCTDLCISAIRARFGCSSSLLSDLTRWTLLFLRDRVCAWVANNGGWTRVLHQGLDLAQQVVFIAACAAVVTTCVIYLRSRR